MKNLFFTSFLILLSNCKKQDTLFKIETKTVNKKLVDELKQTNFPNSPYLLYNDKKYEIYKSCSGEWGGTIYFKNKETGKIHYAIATCPVSVNKINGKYYISNSLSHMMGSSDILEISDPEKMQTTLNMPTFAPNVITREYEAKSKNGTKTVVDSSEVIIATSFVYCNKLYSILSDIQGTKTTISELKNNKFQTVATLPADLFHSEPIIIKDSEHHQKLYFQNPKSGILEIKDNLLKLSFYEKE